MLIRIKKRRKCSTNKQRFKESCLQAHLFFELSIALVFIQIAFLKCEIKNIV